MILVDCALTTVQLCSSSAGGRHVCCGAASRSICPVPFPKGSSCNLDGFNGCQLPRLGDSGKLRVEFDEIVVGKFRMLPVVLLVVNPHIDVDPTYDWDLACELDD